MTGSKLIFFVLIIFTSVIAQAQKVDTAIYDISSSIVHKKVIPDKNPVTISIQVFASDKDKKPQKEISFKWQGTKTDSEAANIEAMTKIQSVFAENEIDCPFIWLYAGKGIIKCANGTIITVTGASPSFIACFSPE